MTGSATIWHRLDRFPPILLRLLSRVRHGRPLTSLEISQRSGLKVGKIEHISESHDWTGIDVPTVKAFLHGCDTDIFSRSDYRRLENYLAGTKVKGKRYPPNFRYLRISPQWNSYYKVLLTSWLKNKGKP